MNIQFDVVWVEDNSDWLDSNSGQFLDLSAYILEAGFVPRIQKFTDYTLVKPAAVGRACDLLVVDFNLSDDGKVDGADLIDRIQQKSLIADTIFYSAKGRSELYKAAADMQLEGIFFSGRTQVFSKAKEVFDVATKKVIDLSNMRGVVMAGVSDLDERLTSILRSKHAVLAGPQLKKFLDRIRERIEKRVKKEAVVAELDDAAAWDVIEAAITGPFFDLSNRREVAMGLAKDHKYLAAYKSTLESFQELIAWRNALAHQAPAEKKGDLYFKVNKVERLWNEKQSRALRTEIVRLLDEFGKILDAVLRQAAQ